MINSKIVRIVSFLLVISSFFAFLAAPAFARESGGDRGGFWDVVYSYSGSSGYGEAVLKGLGKLSNKEACPSSETGYHLGSPYHVRQPGQRSVYAADCRCDFCGSEFTVVLSANELSAAYNAYVEELPASGFTSSGSFI